MGYTISSYIESCDKNQTILQKALILKVPGKFKRRFYQRCASPGNPGNGRQLACLPFMVRTGPRMKSLVGSGVTHSTYSTPS